MPRVSQRNPMPWTLVLNNVMECYEMTSKRNFHNAMLAAVIDLCTKDSKGNIIEDDFLKELSSVVDKHFESDRVKFVELASAIETIHTLLSKNMSALSLCDAMGVFDENKEDNVSIDVIGLIKQMFGADD